MTKAKAKAVKEPVPQAAASDDPLAALMGAAGAAPIKSGKKAATVYPVVKLTGKDAEAFDRYLMFGAVMDIAKGHCELNRSLVDPKITNEMLTLWVKSGAKSSIRVETEKSNALISPVDNSKRLKIAPYPDGRAKSFKEFCQEEKIPSSVSDKLLEKEVKEEVKLEFASPQDLISQGHPDLAKKISQAIMAAGLTPAELQLVVKRVNYLSVNPEFLTRATSYIVGTTDKEKADSLEQVVNLMNWTTQYKSKKPPQDISQAIDVVKKGEKAKSGDGGTTEYESSDKQFKVVAEGDVVSVFRYGQLIGKKKCEDEGHAKNTVKILSRKASYINELLQDMDAAA